VKKMAKGKKKKARIVNTVNPKDKGRKKKR
jgi:hypothetical protein